MSAFYDYSGGGRFPQYTDFRPGGTGTNDYGETYDELTTRLRAEDREDPRRLMWRARPLKGSQAAVKPPEGKNPQEWAVWLYGQGLTAPMNRDRLKAEGRKLAEGYPGSKDLMDEIARRHKALCVSKAKARFAAQYL